MKKILLLCCLLLTICVPAQSEIMEATSATHPIYNGDGYFYDNISDLTWKKITTYIPYYSFEDIVTDLAGTDFRMATLSEVQALIESSKDQPFNFSVSKKSNENSLKCW